MFLLNLYLKYPSENLKLNYTSGYRAQLSTLIDAGDDPEEDFIVTIYATPSKPFDTSCLYESNV